MLSSHLSDQQSIEDFTKDKSDREIAIVGLTLIDQHVKECSDRWFKVAKGLRYLSVGIVVILVERVSTDIHWGGVSKIVETFMSMY